ncbi:MAG: pancreas/duodenum homeobox protein 1, partial [Proteobacteria bacterium]|nr:pancreas/duodenum homeobox protein 1 [Pseudomonadota bacterium]
MDIFTYDVLKKLFPEERADMFFDALLGDVNEGAYDISLAFNGHNDGELQFELQLRPRPGRCLACNLTYGLP